jgi:predicted SprT family Zn-dependent metalloprotease
MWTIRYNRENEAKTLKGQNMELTAGKDLTLDLMMHHKLYSWFFKWNHAKLQHGRCHHGPKMITLSKHFVNLNDVNSITQTILHEIAHALVGPGHGHDYMWRIKAREIGVKRPTPAKHSNMPAFRYTASCPKCGPLRGSGKHRLSKRHNFTCVRCNSEIIWKDTKDLVLN